MTLDGQRMSGTNPRGACPDPILQVSIGLAISEPVSLSVNREQQFPSRGV